jgi:phage FluMu protein Com
VNNQYIEIRCPFQIAYISNTSGMRKTKTCGKICVKVTAGSAGETYCSRCKRTFDFEISSNESISTKVIARAVK